MNLPHKNSPRKQRPEYYKPTHEEGLYIHFILKAKKLSFVRIAKSLGVAPQTVANITLGQRRSSRIKLSIAQMLGKQNWSEVVLEARSIIKRKPIEQIKKDIKQQWQTKKKETKNRMREYATASYENAIQAIPDVGSKGRKSLNRKAVGL